MSTIKLNDCRHIIEASDANLSESRFEDSRMAHITFREMTLEGSSFTYVMMDNCRFDHVSLTGVQLTNCRYEGMTIDGIPVLDLLAAHRSVSV